ncbi:MAG: M28 family peptidase [Actinomycetota bacterium]|nr:M28 family peptidase [Actinomycetota bacterium]
MNLPSRHTLTLSKKIGRRPPGSENEAASASYILHSMSELEINVDMETISSWNSDWSALVLICFIALFAYSAYLLNMTISVVLSLFTFFAFLMETFSWGILSRLFPRSTASNIVAKINPSQERRKIVVLSANYDTPKSSFFGRKRVSRFFRPFYFMCFISILIFCGLSIFGAIGKLAKFHKSVLTQVWLCCLPFALLVFLFALILLQTELNKNYTAGANDNASGVAVLLSVLSSLASAPLEFVEVWGVATARAYAGGRGMVSFLRRHRRKLKKSLILNIDHPGRGQLSVVTREGVIFGFRSSRKIIAIVKSISRKSKRLSTGKAKNRVKKSDSMVALARGYNALTIGGFSGGTFPGWRSPDDTFDHLERDNMDKAIRLIVAILDEVDSRA